jgi:hypothetical protein
MVSFARDRTLAAKLATTILTEALTLEVSPDFLGMPTIPSPVY